MSCVSWCNYNAGIVPEKNDPDSVLRTWEIELSTFSNWLRNKILGHVFTGTVFVPPSALYIACHSTSCSAATPGTELTDANYTRTAITFERVSDIKYWNPSELSTAGFAGLANVASMSIWDSPVVGGGNYYAFGNLSAVLEVSANNGIVWQANKVVVGLGEAPS